MTPSQLKTRIAAVTHKSDLTGQMDNFLADALAKINERFGVNLTQPASGVDYPAGTDLLFYYAALVSTYEFTHNVDAATYYNDKFELWADRQNVLSPGSETDNYATINPFIAGDYYES
ncbi:hypothetical protein [uncultured Paraglaciecola sp.]|uniref:hypothetical protein n=1 Tax=uncultured Paraglaciecola sp. TaxID=1765024 RepID=UPI002617F700|nr:hypothetical protein [uncultured Paraglaciecola sp.]